MKDSLHMISIYNERAEKYSNFLSHEKQIFSSLVVKVVQLINGNFIKTS